jgi:hypothetical protein
MFKPPNFFFIDTEGTLRAPSRFLRVIRSIGAPAILAIAVLKSGKRAVSELKGSNVERWLRVSWAAGRPEESLPRLSLNSLPQSNET